MNYYLEYWPMSIADVDEGDWGFLYHMDKLHRRWVFLRRVLRIVRCVNPKTGALDMLFPSLVESSEWGDAAAHRWASAVLDEFYEDTCAFLTAMADCISCLSPTEYSARLEIWRQDLSNEETAELAARGRHNARSREVGQLQVAFLIYACHAQNVVCKWEEKLRQLQTEETLMVWKQASVRRGAQVGGKKAGENKRRLQLASPEKVQAHFEKLRMEGHSERSIASTVAKRLNVTPDHVRRVRRALEEKPM